MRAIYLTYRISLLQSAPKIHTDLLWDLTWLFLILAIVYFGAVFYYRNRISAKSKKVGLRKTELSPIVSEFLFYEENATNDEKSKYIQLKVEIRQLIKDDFNRRVLSEVLLDLRKDVSGDTQNRLFKLYKDLGLHKDAYKKLKSWKWHVVSKGILELTQMRVEESYGLITKFINDKRSTIRKQAEIATVTLKYEGINYFLDNTRFKISEWQQLKLLDVLRNFEDYQPPRFKAWLTSSNRNVVLFALRLIKYYNQNDAKSSLLELIKHKNNRIKSEAITCIKEFYVIEARELLKTIFWKCTADIKIQILDVLAKFGQEGDLDFLDLIEKKESNFSVKSKALSAINTIRPESILPTEGILDISGYQIPEDIVIKSEVKKEIDFEDDLCEVPHLQPETLTEVSPESISIAYDIEAPPAHEGESSIEKRENEMNKNSLTEVGHMKSQGIEETQFDIRQVEVVFEEVSEILPTETLDKEVIDFKTNDFIDEDLKDIDLSFLPHVLSPEAQPESIDETNIEKYVPNKSVIVDDILDIEVCYAEVQSNQLQKMNDSVSAEETQNLADQWIGIESFEEIKNEKYRPTTAKIRSNVKDIKVVFDELNSPREENTEDGIQENEKEKIGSSYAIDETELNFLPIVVDAIENHEKPELETLKYTPSKQNNEESLLQIFDYEVEYDEVVQIPKETNQDLPIQDPLPITDRPLAINEIAPKYLFGLEVIFEEVGVGGNKEEIFNEIPKIEFYSEETLQIMSLLDDIEELGDKREIPLLLEYLEEATEREVRNRIREIVKKFAQWEPGSDDTTSKVVENDIPLEYNVLEELFRGVDLEEKIILLDAVSDIVDEKDLPFLMKVKDDPEQELRDQATIMIMELEKRLALQDKEEKSFPEENDPTDDQEDSELFKVEFEIEISRENSNVSDNELEVAGKENSFLEQLLTIPNKIIQSFNG